jgi:hypothetical protein
MFSHIISNNPLVKFISIMLDSDNLQFLLNKGRPLLLEDTTMIH